MAFEYAVQYLEDYNDETITLDDFHHITKLNTGLSDDEDYSKVQLKRCLLDHYREKYPSPQSDNNPT